MTAQKLPMPGLRYRTGGEEGEDAAGAAAGRGWGGPPSHAQQAGIENGCAATASIATGGRWEQQQQARCGNNSSQAGLPGSVMQPLPLASRYVGTPKQDALHPAGSALGSSWIRRFLPGTGAELGKEVTRGPKGVWGGGQAVGGGGEPGSQPAGFLLLAAAPNEQYKDQHLQREVGMAKARMGLGSFKETSGKVPRNGEHAQKRRGPLEMEERDSRQEPNIGVYELAENGVQESLRKVNTHPSHAGGAYAVEGSSRLQQHEGNHKPFLSTRGESQANGSSGARTGFGPFQVFMKAPATDYGKVGVSGGSKLKGMDWEARVDADARTAAQPDAHRFSNNASDLLDRKPSGTSTMASQAGTEFNPLSKSKVVEGPRSGRPPCAVDGAWGFSRSTKKEAVEPDVGSGRPFMAPLDGGSKETAAMVGGGGLKASESPARFNPFGERNCRLGLESGHVNVLDHESGVDRLRIGNSKFNGDGFVSGYPAVNLGRKEDGGQSTESRFLSRPAEDASTKPNAGAGLENRKTKGVVGFGFPSGRHTEAGPSQQQHSPEIPPHALHPFQEDLFIGKIGHPLPYSPHSSFPGEDNSGEDTRNSRGRVDRANSPLTLLFGAPKVYEDGMDGRAAQPEQQAPWTSLYAAFKGLKHAEVENSSSSTPTLPLDLHSRFQDGSMPANRPSEAHKVNGDRDKAGGGRGRTDAYFPASPDARSRFDDQSSHFSSSPRPDEEGHIPNDDTGSGPYNPQATGSYHQSQASRIANRSSGDAKGKHVNTSRYDAGVEPAGLDKATRSRQASASEPDLGKYAGSQGEDEGQQMSYDGKQAYVPSIPLKHSPKQSVSGCKDDTSDSSPPSCPPGYNSSDSPVLPRGIVDEHLSSIARKLKNVDVDSEMEGIRVPKIRKGNRRDEVVFAPKRTLENMNSSNGDHEAPYREHAFLSKGPDLQRTHAPVIEVNREVNRPGHSNEGLEPGLRHGKLRMSGEAMGEGGTSGPSKRTRHQFNLGSNDLGSQMAGSGMPSSWLTRWLPPATANAARSPGGFARPNDDPRNGLNFEPPRSNGSFMAFSEERSGQARFVEVAQGKNIEKGNERKVRNGLIGAKRGLLGLPPHPVPSAAAIALVGTAARKRGPFPQQRRGSVAMWPPVRLRTAQAPESGQRSS